MAFRSRSLSRPRDHRHYETIDSAAVGNNLYVETHLTTPHSLALPPLHSTLSDNGYIVSTYDSKGRGMVDRRDIGADRQPRSMTNLLSPPGQHFFITPREVVVDGRHVAASGLENGSVCSGSIITDSRNPAQEHRSGARSIFRAGRHSLDSQRDDRGNSDDYDDFSAKIRDEMNRMKSEMFVGNASHREKVHSVQPKEFSHESTRQNHRLDRETQTQTDSSSISASSKGTQVNLVQGDRLSKDMERRHQSVVERNNRLERELADKKSQIVEMKLEGQDQAMGYERHSESHRRVAERKMHLEQELMAKDSELRTINSELATKDSQILELTRKLQSMEQANHKLSSDRYRMVAESDRLAEKYTKDLDDIEVEYKKALDEAVAENDMLRRDLDEAREARETLQSENELFRIDERESRMLRGENEKLKNDIEDMRRMRYLAEEDLEICQRNAKEMQLLERDLKERQHYVKDIETKYDDMKKLHDIAQQDLKTSQHTIRELESKYDEAVKDKTRAEARCEEAVREKDRHETVAEDMKLSYHRILEEKIREENTNKELRQELDNANDEFDSLAKENNSLKGRLELLDEVTEALEIAMDEKNEAVGEFHELRRENERLQDAIESITSTLENALDEKTRTLNRVTLEKEEIKNRYDDLEREMTMLQSKRESEVYMTEMLTKQRDKLNVSMDKYLDEIEKLKQTNSELMFQRDDLKKELICVLETASGYQD